MRLGINAALQPRRSLQQSRNVQAAVLFRALQQICQGIDGGVGRSLVAADKGLRAIMEEVLLPVMYDIPSRDDVAKVVVTKAVVLEGTLPKLVKKSPKEKSA